MTIHVPLPQPFLSRITVRHGPTELLGRFFLAANSAVEARGLRLEFTSFEELLAVNRANADSWLPLTRTFDPHYSRLDSEAAFCIAGRDAQGRIVNTIAARRLDWRQTTFAEEITSLRLLYADPERDREPAEAFTVTPGLGDGLRGIIGWTGAAWCHPSVRRQGLSGIMSRIVRGYACTRWDTDYIAGYSSERVGPRGYWRRTGFVNSAWAIEAHNSPATPPHLGLGWLDATETLQDLGAFMDVLAEERAAVAQRTAN